MSGRGWLWTGFGMSALAFAGFLVAGGGGTYVTPPLLIAVAMAAALGGPLPGGGVAFAGWLMIVLRGSAQLSNVYLVIVLATVVLLSDRAASELRRARSRAERRLDLLAVLLSTLRRVASARGAGDLDVRLPASLEARDGEGLRVWATVPGRPVDEGEAGAAPSSEVLAAVKQVIRDKKPHFGTVVGGHRARHLAALPVQERGDVVAVVTTLRDDRVSGSERAILQEFTTTLGHVLTNLHEERSGELVLQLMQRAAASTSDASLALALLEVAVAELGLWGGAVMRYRAGRFVAQATFGELPEEMLALLRSGLAFGEGAIWSVYRAGRASYLEDYQRSSGVRGGLLAYGVGALAMVPVSGAPLSHVVVLLMHDAPRPWLASERSLLEELALVLRVTAEQRDTEARLQVTGRLQRELLATPVERMYGQLLQAAVRLIPGSEAASLLELGGDGRYRFVATVGYDRQGLEQVSLTVPEMQAWYGQDQQGWASGRPRVLSTDNDGSVADASVRAAPVKPFEEAGRIDEIVANLCLPVVYGGEVLAILNLDAMHDPDAFGPAAREAAAGLVPFLGFLLHEVDVRRQLAAAARTDALTGLANRRAFDEQAGHDVSRAVRYAEPLALLVMDLHRFKQVNDRFGHAAGDETLQGVAEALRRSSRAGDRVFRWGGDEFAALLAHADGEVALTVAQRIARNAAAVPVPGGRLRLDIGAACVPEDGTELADLLRVADRRMFRAKATGRVELSDSA